MKDWEEQAQGNVEVILARDQQGRAFEIVAPNLLEADDVTGEGQFPQYGSFVSCRNSPDGDAVFVEVPQGLAQEMTRDGSPDPREGLVFVVEAVRKTAEGNWNYTVQYPNDWDDAADILNSR